MTLGIGVDQIPEEIRNSPVLSGNNLGRLANVECLPSPEELALFSAREDLEDIRRRFRLDEESYIDHLHRWAKEELEAGNVDLAWKILLQKKG
jgi:hypothetical protein